MKRPQWGLYAVALAILAVGLVWAGVPASTLLVAGAVLVCPLMMFVMMRGMSHENNSVPDRRHEHDTNDRTGDLHGTGRR